MPTLVGSYSLRNLIQSLEFLLKLTRTLNEEINELEKAKTDVKQEQSEAQKQGHLVKKMTNYMSEELARLELSNTKDENSSNPSISKNLEKLSVTETKLRVLRGRLSEFVDGEDEESLKAADVSLAVELKQYEAFLLDLTNLTNEKIANLEKIVNRLKAEKRESQQQKLLLKEMVDLFNEEIEDLEHTFRELKA